MEIRQTLEQFIGKEFDLTAASTAETALDPRWEGAERENASTLTFTLDGVTWQAQEDPNDGYRSSLGSLMRGDVKLSNTFPPCRVRAEWEPDMEYCKNEVVVFRSVETGLPVLEVGTSNTDDYYPNFVGNFIPEGMDVNAPALVEKREKERKLLEEAVAREALGWGSF